MIFIIIFFYIIHLQLIHIDAPNCTITRKEDDGEDTLICVADGNPEDYQYEWDFKSENETDVDKELDYKTRNKKSYLTLGDVPQKRIYVCRANNTVGPGSQCEISVEGKQFFFHSIRTFFPLLLPPFRVHLYISDNRS